MLEPQHENYEQTHYTLAQMVPSRQNEKSQLEQVPGITELTAAYSLTKVFKGFLGGGCCADANTPDSWIKHEGKGASWDLAFINNVNFKDNFLIKIAVFTASMERLL